MKSTISKAYSSSITNNGYMRNLEVIIGLEIHAQMNTKTKMFCGCDNNAWNKKPNTTVCEICMGHPGTLPVPNREAIGKAARAALALDCTVASDCHFDRKHYFYPDLPMGFQISQYDFPLASKGYVDYDLPEGFPSPHGRGHGEGNRCRIHHLHLENDAGKLTHVGGKTLCDFNRAGTPLMEIVTEPDLRSAVEAVAFAQELRSILVTIGASEADMFKGMMRFDASISLREKGIEKLNPRSEIKNLNSFKALERALTYEEERLRKLWEESGGPLKGNITVGWLDDTGCTRVLREKEDAQDYRYFPEPDIPPLTFSAKEIENVRASIPHLPRMQRKSYLIHGLDTSQAQILLDEPKLRSIFDAVLDYTKDAHKTSGIVLTQLLGAMQKHGKAMKDLPHPDSILDLLDLVASGAISSNAAKRVIEDMVKTGKPAGEIVEEHGLTQIADSRELQDIVASAIAANPNAVLSFKKGKTQALGAIVGWVMKETGGKVDPARVSEMLQKGIS